MPKLLAKYSRLTSVSADQVQKIPLTPLAEYHKYLAICDETQQRDAYDDDNGMDCFLAPAQERFTDYAMILHESPFCTGCFCSRRKGF